MDTMDGLPEKSKQHERELEEMHDQARGMEQDHVAEQKRLTEQERAEQAQARATEQGGAVKLTFSPGEIRGMIPGELPHEVTVPVPPLSSAAKDEVRRHLGGDPLALYRLLQGRPVPELAAWLPSSATADEVAVARCTCGAAACGHAAAVLAAARPRLAAEPLQQLALLGLQREELLAGVFDAWARAIPQAAGGSAEAASLPKEKAPAGPSPGEWLAEAAAEGRLHRPGPLLREMEVRLTPPPPPEQLGPEGDWTGLLPQVRGAAKALELVVRRTADEAERLRQDMTKP